MQDLKEQTEQSLPSQEIIPTRSTSTVEIPNPTFRTSKKYTYFVVVFAVFGVSLVGIISIFFYYSARSIDQAVLTEPSRPVSTEAPVSTVLDSTTPSVEYPEYVYEPTIDLHANGRTHFDAQENISFKYPRNLLPLELGEGVVTFFKSENDLLACKNKSEEYACYKSYFTYNGARGGTTAEIPEDLFEPHTITDNNGRTWTIEALMAAAHNYTAYTTIDGVNVLIAFQGNPKGNIEDFSRFADQILSTVEFTD